MSLTELEQSFSRGFDFKLGIGVSDDAPEVGARVSVLGQSTELTLGFEDGNAAQDGLDAVTPQRDGKTVIGIGHVEAL